MGGTNKGTNRTSQFVMPKNHAIVRKHIAGQRLRKIDGHERFRELQEFKGPRDKPKYTCTNRGQIRSRSEIGQ